VSRLKHYKIDVIEFAGGGLNWVRINREGWQTVEEIDYKYLLNGDRSPSLLIGAMPLLKQYLPERIRLMYF